MNIDGRETDPDGIGTMKACPQMAAFFRHLLKKHGIKRTKELRGLDFRLEGYPELTFYFYDRRVYMYQSSLENNVYVTPRYATPRVRFDTYRGQWVPYEIAWPHQRDEDAELFGIFDTPDLVPFMGFEEEQAETARLCEEWAQCLIREGWLEGAVCHERHVW